MACFGVGRLDPLRACQHPHPAQPLTMRVASTPHYCRHCRIIAATFTPGVHALVPVRLLGHEMARLQDPPKKQKGGVVSRDLSPPPHSSSSSSGEEANAASQQLLAEASGPATEPPPSSAVLGADLLNAARIPLPHGRGDRTRKHGTGKLKRVTLPAEGPQHNLARRGDVYNIELSPEKGPYVLPERVNPKKLKLVRKKKRPQLNGGEAGEAEEEPQQPSSPPRPASAGSATHLATTEIETRPRNSSSGPSSSEHGLHSSASADVLTEKTFADGKLPCTAVFHKYDKQAGSRYQQCLRVGTKSTDAGPRCGAHDRKAAAARCGHVTVEDDKPARCHKVATTEISSGPRCPAHPEPLHRDQTAKMNQAVPEATSKREFASDHGSERPRKLRKSQKQKADKPVSTKETGAEVCTPMQKSAQKEQSVPPRVEKRTRSQTHATIDTTASNRRLSGQERKTRSPEMVSQRATAEEAVTDQSDGNAEESIADQDDDSKRDTEMPGAIEAVFKFLDLGERSGRCEIERASKIMHRCNQSFSHLEDDNVSMDAVIEDADGVRKMLKRASFDVEEKDRLAFRVDAYGHIFRALTLYLEALYKWLLEKCGTVIESLPAVRILSSLIHDTLAFKDTITSWNVSVPQRYKGDRMIADVDEGLIAPLRQADKLFRTHLSQLEAAERDHEQQQKFMRKMKKKAEEQQRTREAEEARNAKWVRWQNLHIARMSCEPDPNRRRRLETTKQDLEERDANGITFERVPVFRSRSTPPHHQVQPLLEDREWNEEQETALIDGLKAFAGPKVFENIFERHCRPRLHGRHVSSNDPTGLLRDFTVTDIVGKARWIRSQSLRVYQDKAEDWMIRIPILP
ncbi:hypothetical protein BDW02DRAFT_192311 [Decorospora gaudefroyi]|uniref:Uncharacterized protein n=1 Tax=Decorospora gaudefroyi TaxID=184978 RepID=A0A6A5JZ01_9PLEO|nr:hypothetical protein BDW02DRAFT_192311 [Decorospora gaudefroyi]